MLISQKLNLTQVIKALMLLALSTTNACAMTPKSTYDAQTQTTKYAKPFKPTVSVPFDITKKGNKLELILQIKEDRGYSFELEFHYEDPRRSKYFAVELVTEIYRNFFPKRYTDEEYKEITKDENRVRKLVGGPDWERKNDQWIRTDYPGIPTPIHLTIIKLEDDGSEKIVFDEIRDKWEGQNFVGCGPLSCNKELQRMLLKKGSYKIFVQAIKDSLELMGTKIHFSVGRGRGKY